MTSVHIAVVVRAQDGPFQPMVIGLRPDASVYRLTGRVLRRVRSFGISPILYSLVDIEADVFVFLTAPIETLNHVCLDALASEVLNPECGIASATGVDAKQLFAVRRELLSAAGGLSRLSEDRIADLFALLADRARAQQLRVVITSRAVATPAF